MSEIKPGMYANSDGSCSVIVYPLEGSSFDVQVTEDDEEWMASFSAQDLGNFIQVNELVWKRELTEYEKDL